MTNFELELEFENIFRTEDCFDSFVALKKLKKQYKKTDFYKQTHLSLYKAYELYIKNKTTNVLRFLTKFASVEEVGQLLTNYLNAIDEEAIENIFSKFNNIFNAEQFQQIQGELKASIDKLKA